ncbi:WYL domain-containing protein [Streptomyces milbemycinicus]|uniref:WYL domain-containing protein n=1 Tax=Streptomyces milbemycinicus TaxID=476552 RepID=UPI0033F89078
MPADLASRRFLIDPVRWRGTPGPDHPAADLAAFQQAVYTDRRLCLRYRHGRDNRVRTYTLAPYGLVSKAGVRHLVADHDGVPRLLRTVLDQPAAATAWSSPRCGTPCASTSPTSPRLNPAGSPEAEREPGWTRVELRFRALVAAAALLSFGPDAEVLAPDDLRQALARKAAATAALSPPTTTRQPDQETL